MKNLETAFQHIRLFTICIVTGSFLLCAFVLLKSYQLFSVTQSKIYVLANGKALEAIAAERKDNIPVEAKDHIRMFHYFFFTLDPDEKVIGTNVTKALYMADGSAQKQYDNLKENGYYSNLISANISQEIVVDSIALDTDKYPYAFRCYSTQKIIRVTSVVTRNLITEGVLRNVTRSDNNPHGFLIEKWSTLSNMDLKIENR